MLNNEWNTEADRIYQTVFLGSLLLERQLHSFKKGEMVAVAPCTVKFTHRPICLISEIPLL